MSNEYYTAQPVARRTLARAEAVNANTAAVQAGFDRLPAPDALARGAVTFNDATGAANIYAVNMPKAWTAYQDGALCMVRIPVTNTGASTLSVDGLGARPIRTLLGQETEADDLVAGDLHMFLYDNTNAEFQMITLTRSYASGATDLQQVALQAIESARVAAVADLEAIEGNVELLEASAVAATGIDVSAQNDGDLLQVVGSALAMSGQRLENAGTFSGTSITLNLVNTQHFRGLLTGNTTFSFDASGFADLSNSVVYWVLEVQQDTSTAYTWAFAQTIKWDNDDIPDPPDATKTSILTFKLENGVIYGTQIGRDFS